MTRTDQTPTLSELTTMHVGGPCGSFAEPRSPEEFADAVRTADAAGTPVFVIGMGSNVLVGDEGFSGLVVRPAYGEVDLEQAAEGRALVHVGAGCTWDGLVERCVEHGLAGVEALSGIPGRIGSAVMQNIGAYGQEMGTALVSATLYDREVCEVVTMDAEDLGLGYRTSMLRDSLEEGQSGRGPWYPTSRWVVLGATFALVRQDLGTVGHPQLARALGCEVGDRVPIRSIREHVLAVRTEKAMVADSHADGAAPDHDRWSSGSFFTNPVIPLDVADGLPAEAPRYDAGQKGVVKTSAAWLIEHAGFPKGWGVHGARSAATLSTRHTLALTNRGSATCADMVELARAVRDGVRQTFGIDLVPETVLVGVSLDD